MRETKKEAFEYYYSQNYTAAFRYILKKVNDFSLAEDLAMESFLSCLQNFDRFDPSRASFQTWLFVVVNNKLKNYFRDRKVHEDIDECDEFCGGFEDDILAAEHLSALRNTLAESLDILSDTQRSIVIMRYFKNMQSKEIGEKLGMQPGNVRVQLSRVLEKLRSYFRLKNIEWEL